MSQHDGTFEQAAERALAALGADPSTEALDAWADPIGAAQGLAALESGREVAVVRAAFDLSSTGGAQGPDPAAPSWIRVVKGSPDIRLCSAEATCETRKVARVVVEAAPLPDGSEGAIARVSLALDRKGAPGAKLLVAEAWARSEETAIGRVRGFAAKLARALSAPASLPADAGGDEAEGAGSEEASIQGVSARSLARFALRSEGPRLVLRDFDSRGPKEGALLHLVIGLAFAGAAAFAWTMFARAGGEPGASGSAVWFAWLGGSALLTLAAVAFLGVARFALQYKAGSAPLVAIGAGKVTVAPWVARTGALMTAPEGRFGAGIDFAEVGAVTVQPRKGLHAVEVATDHGAIDALLIGDRAVAEHLARALGRAIDDMRPAGGGPSARQRFRMRAGSSAKPPQAAAVAAK